LGLGAPAAGYTVPKGYRLDDQSANHNSVARSLADAGRMKEAIESFRAACRFTHDAVAYMNLGVALMRDGSLGAAHRALSEAARRDPGNDLVAENMDSLQEVARSQGVSSAKLEALGREADLKLSAQAATQASSGGSKRSSHGGGGGDSVGKLENGQARILRTPKEIALRGREWTIRGEKRLGRGYISLALHINPWLAREMPSWFTDLVNAETWSYWSGNLFVGYDKTQLENLASDHFRETTQEPQLYELALYAWRNLQLTEVSCCGIDNVAVFLSMAKRFGHPYLIPFMHLVPDYLQYQLKKENRVMYESFKSWWESNGRRPMPTPQITFEKRRWDWEAMKVALPAKRVPDGWDEMLQAALLYRLGNYEGARTCLHQALSINEEIASVVDELLPGMSEFSLPRPVAPHLSSQQKYVVCYNPAVGLGNQAVVMVSAHALAKLTGRTLIIHWNVNHVLRHAYQVRDQPGVQVISENIGEASVVPHNVRTLYFFHMMDSLMMSEVLELLGCSNVLTELNSHPVVAVSSNLYFAPLLATNPHVPASSVPDFPEAMASLLQPSTRAQKRALAYANKTDWGRTAPVVAIHIRARETGEDNDDWPTKDAADDKLLGQLVRCVQKAVARELGEVHEWDAFVAATTEKARTTATNALRQSAKGIRNVLGLPKVERNRRSGAGNTDAMAEALLFSRADIFVRLVIGTSGFSTFAFLSNALRVQTSWAKALPPLRKVGYAPNYVVTTSCGSGTCFLGSPKVRMADVSWHGPRVTKRSCGDVIQRISASSNTDRCRELHSVDDESDEYGPEVRQDL